MEVGHRSNKANTLPAPGDLIVHGRTIRSKLGLRNQTAIPRFDHPLCLIDRHKIFIIEYLGCAYGHHLDETENQIALRRELYQRNQLVLISAAHQDGVQFDLLEACSDRCVDST
jgi:hypothetical protein